MFNKYKNLIFISGLFFVFLMYIVISCSGGGGGGGFPPLPTFDTSTTFFPTFTTTTDPFTTTTTNTYPTTTTTNNNYKFLYVKVLRNRNGNIEWLGSYDWNDSAYVHFSAYNDSYHDKTVYVNDGYYGAYSKFYYDRYYADYVDIGLYRYYYGYDYIVKIGDNYYSSSEAWDGRFNVDDYGPYGNSIYIVFGQDVTFNKLGQKIR